MFKYINGKFNYIWIVYFKLVQSLKITYIKYVDYVCQINNQALLLKHKKIFRFENMQHEIKLLTA